MTQDQLEQVYEALAQAIDRTGAEQAEVFLAKVALALADELGDSDRVQAMIAECETGLGRRD